LKLIFKSLSHIVPHTRKHWPASIIVLLFVVLGLIYSIVTPVFEMSDETRHYAVVKFMADEHRLPVQAAGEAQRHWSHEGNQPPLYYGLAALLTGWIDTGTWDDVYWYNPHTSVGVPLRTDNENMTIHTAREAFPWRGYALAVHLVRFLSVAMGAVTVGFAYAIALELFKGDRWLAVGATAITAFNPMFVFISSAVNNDNLVILFCSAATWLLIRMVRQGAGVKPIGPLWGKVGLLGVLIGLGALSKLYALGMLPVAGLVLLWVAHRHKSWRDLLVWAILLGATVALVAGWWYWRNFLLYGDWLALNPMRQVAGQREEAPTLNTLLAEFQGFRIAYWALFGGVNVLVQQWIYDLLDWASALAALGLLVMGILALVRREVLHRLRIDWPSVAVAGLWYGVMIGGFVVWNLTQPAAQGRLMYPAIASISALGLLGLTWWLPRSAARGVALALASALFVFAAASPFVYIAPAYAKPPLLTQADVPADLPRLDWVIDGKMRLIGARIEQPRVRAAETLPVTVYWQALEPMDINYSVFVHLFGRGGQKVGQFDTYPGLGAWPTTLLKPGDVIADTYPVPVWPEAEQVAPSALRVLVGLYDYHEPGRPARPTVDAAGQPVNLQVGWAKLVPWEWPQIVPVQPLDITFGDGIRLSGYDLSAGPSPDSYTLQLIWQPAARPSADYTVFLQVWDGDEQVAGFDGPPVGGDYPTSWWEAGEVIVDEHGLDLGGLAPGHYRLLVGLYRLDTGERLPAFDSNGTPLPNFALEIPWRVTSP
jgi:4-amino-4-deoxy-L-arabinose transferase-like glycosyltransferase